MATVTRMMRAVKEERIFKPVRVKNNGLIEERTRECTLVSLETDGTEEGVTPAQRYLLETIDREGIQTLGLSTGQVVPITFGEFVAPLKLSLSSPEMALVSETGLEVKIAGSGFSTPLTGSVLMQSLSSYGPPVQIKPIDQIIDDNLLMCLFDAPNPPLVATTEIYFWVQTDQGVKTNQLRFTWVV